MMAMRDLKTNEECKTAILVLDEALKLAKRFNDYNFIDTETNSAIDLFTLAWGFIENIVKEPGEYKRLQFSKYLANCMVENNGTLELAKKKVAQDEEE